ncbi:MAG: TerC family protein [Hyphomicrobiaceae bacterium]
MLAWITENWLGVLNVLLIDLVLAGDNAVVVGLVASRVAPNMRAKVIFWGIAAAVVMRISLAAIATQLLQIIGLTLAGGILLLWVCWKMYRQIVSGHEDESGVKVAADGSYLPFGAAVFQVMLADLTMSLDNVLAVAGAAKGSTGVLVIGLAVAIVLMAVASHYIAKLLVKHPWITWIGLLIILWVALEMIWKGSHEVACKAYSSFWCNNDLAEFFFGRVFGF